MSNIKTISQATGGFIDDDSVEPGFVVNMDDPGASDFIDKVRKRAAPVEVLSSSASPVVQEEGDSPDAPDIESEDTEPKPRGRKPKTS